jgi:hypothetical protein
MKLNPEKCTFGVPAGQLLGYLVSARGIEANPTKIAAIERMERPASLKDVQKFAGCMASVSRFLSRLGEKALPLYALLKKTGTFVWNDQAEKAFDELKKMLSTALVLAAPASKEPMMMYIAATNRVVSVVLVVERPEPGKAQPVQRPVYYVSEVLSLSKQNSVAGATPRGRAHMKKRQGWESKASRMLELNKNLQKKKLTSITVGPWPE